jgi:hypothetical protein
MPLNAAIKWLVILFRIRDVPGLNLGQEFYYSERFFAAFLSTSRQVLKSLN